MLGRLLGSFMGSGVDRLGDWNPQLLRELKGRLKRLPLTVTIILSLALQCLVVGILVFQLPRPVTEADSFISHSQLVFDSQEISHNSALQEHRYQLNLMWPSNLEVNSQIEVGDQVQAINGEVLPQALTIQTLHGQGQVKASGILTLTMPADQPLQIDAFDTIKSYAIDPQKTIQLPADEITMIRPGVGTFTVTIPKAFASYNPTYCLNQICSLAEGERGYVIRIDWASWNRDLFISLSSIMVILLPTAGTFLLVNNVMIEQQRGTLNFIRLSPRSALSILGGKVLGVPICIYLGVALAVPLQIKAGLGAGLAPFSLVGLYGVSIVQTLLIYTAALLFSLLSFRFAGLQPWLCGGAVAGFQSLILTLFFETNDYKSDDVFNWLWSFSPATTMVYSLDGLKGMNHFTFGFWGTFLDAKSYMALALCNSILWLWILGYLASRKFANPNITLLPRPYSYPLSLVFQLSLLSFGIKILSLDPYDHEDWIFINLFMLAFLNLIFIVILALVLSPNRQTLQDWARFRHIQTAQSSQRLPLWKDSLWGNKSPAIWSIVINILILLALFSVWLINVRLESDRLIFAPIGLIIGAVILALLLSQIILLSPLKRSSFWIGSGVIGIALAHPLAIWLLFFGLKANLNLSGVPLEILTYRLTFIGQWSFMVGLTFLSNRQLSRLGESESKQLLGAARTARMG